MDRKEFIQIFGESPEDVIGSDWELFVDNIVTDSSEIKIVIEK